eukprot:XP_001704398.1 Hypothetical protein GL50803_37897 [Giardia lamblia ATCC 50803]
MSSALKPRRTLQGMHLIVPVHATTGSLLNAELYNVLLDMNIGHAPETGLDLIL